MNPKTIEKLYNLVVMRYRIQNELEKSKNLLEEYGKQDFTIGGLGAMQRLENAIQDLEHDLLRVNNAITICELELGLQDHYAVKEAERIINGGV